MADKGAGLFMGALCLPHITGDFSKANMYVCVLKKKKNLNVLTQNLELLAVNQQFMVH